MPNKPSDSTRRAFMAATGPLPGLGLAEDLSAATPPRTALSRPPDQLQSVHDIVVIGSGYGGAVMATRLAPGRLLCVLERGREWLPAALPFTPTSLLAQFRSALNPLGLFDYRAGTTLDVLSRSGLGGASLVNANVAVSPDRDVFSRWPHAIQHDVLQGQMDTWEAHVRQILDVDTIGELNGLRKHAFRRTSTWARARAGANDVFKPLPIAVHLKRHNTQPNAQGVAQALCTHCGDCVTGCRVSAKNTLDSNYLPLARAAGAETLCPGRARAPARWPLAPASGHAVRHDCAGASSGRRRQRRAGRQGSRQHPDPVAFTRARPRAAAGARLQVLRRRRLAGRGLNMSVQTNVIGFGDQPQPAGECRAGPTITAAAFYGTHPLVSKRHLIEEGAIPTAPLRCAWRCRRPRAASPRFRAPSASGATCSTGAPTAR